MAVACCKALAACPGVSISWPDSKAYNLTELSYWSLQEASLTPSCFATPHTSHEAADVISTLVSNHDCSTVEFAIKGRTHAPAAGFANIDNGVTIDMTGLSSVSTNSDHSVASPVGVGGLTLGGGISYFSPQVGFTCDTVQNFELVLASGELVNANATARPDLFKALKGGTNNFRLVSRFDFATVDIGTILGGSIANNITYRRAVFEAFAGIAGAKDYDVHASIVMGMTFNSTSKAWALSTTPIYVLPETRPKVYEELFAVPNISDTLALTFLHTFANETPTPPLSWQFWTSTYSVSATLLDTIFDIVNSTVYDFEVPDFVLWSFAVEPLPTVFVAPGAGKNSLGTSPAEGNGMILLMSVLWPDTSSYQRVHDKAKEVVEKVDAEAKRMGLLKEFKYTNYADWGQQPLRSYGQDNFDFLRQTARKYDPDGVFQKKVPGGFKVG